MTKLDIECLRALTVKTNMVAARFSQERRHLTAGTATGRTFQIRLIQRLATSRHRIAFLPHSRPVKPLRTIPEITHDNHPRSGEQTLDTSTAKRPSTSEVEMTT